MDISETRVRELEARVAELSALACMLARAHLAIEYDKDIYRAGPIEAFRKLADDEDIPGAFALFMEFKGAVKGED